MNRAYKIGLALCSFFLCGTNVFSLEVSILRVGKATMTGRDELFKEYKRNKHSAVLLRISSSNQEATIDLTAGTVNAMLKGGNQGKVRHMRLISSSDGEVGMTSIGEPNGYIVPAGIDSLKIPSPQGMIYAMFELSDNAGMKVTLPKLSEIVLYLTFLGDSKKVETIRIGDNESTVGQLGETERIALSNAYIGIGSYDLAEKELRTAVNNNPKSSLPHQRLGELLIKEKRLDEALKETSRAIELDPKAIWAYNTRATIHLLKNNQDEALADLDRALNLSPMDFSLNINKAQTLDSLGRKKEAFGFYSKALEAKPGHSFTLYRMAILYFENKDYKECIQLISKNMKPKEETPDLLEIRGISRIKLSELELGVEDIISAFDLFEQRGNNHERLKDLADFIKDLGEDSSLAYELIRRSGSHNGFANFSAAEMFGSLNLNEIKEASNHPHYIVVKQPPKTYSLQENLDRLRKRLCELYVGINKNPWPSIYEIKNIAPLEGMPKTELPGRHPPSSEILTFDKMDGKRLNTVLKDTGKWLYIADPTFRGLNRVLIDCTHKDETGKRYSDY